MNTPTLQTTFANMTADSIARYSDYWDSIKPETNGTTPNHSVPIAAPKIKVETGVGGKAKKAYKAAERNT